MNSENANRILQKAAEEFATSDAIPTYMAEVLIRAPDTPSSKWSWPNQLLMQIGGYTADARGYKQWQAVGRHVKKGAKARYILTPIIKTRKNKKDGEEEKYTVGFHTAPVFAVEDTDGEPLPQYEPKSIPPLFDLAKVTYRNSIEGEGGAYNIQTGDIALCTESPRVFFHELVHKYDAKSYEMKGGQDPVQEIVAEVGSTVLSKMYDVDGSAENHMAYIAQYADAKTPAEVGAACLKVADRVMKAIQLILQNAAKLA